MYCRHCGNKINEEEKFCRNCGKDIHNNSSQLNLTVLSNSGGIKLDKTSVAFLVMSFIVLIVMLVLPVISIPLGDNHKWMLSDTIITGVSRFVTKDSIINTMSPVCFVLMLTALILIVVAAIYKKYSLSAIASAANIIILYIYLSISSSWYDDMMWEHYSDPNPLSFDVGGVFIILLSISTVALSLYNLRKQKSKKSE